MKTIETKVPFGKCVLSWATFWLPAFAIFLAARVSLISTVLAQSTYEPYTFTTLAGLAQFDNSNGDPVGGSADGMGSAARFNGPQGVAADSAGNVYVADQQNNTIRKVTPTGVVTTLAGLAQFDNDGFFVAGPGSADGTGSDARFSYPWGVAVDSAGNVYVADTGNSTIRKVTPKGVVTTLAGLAGWLGSADGTGSAARFNGPQGVAVDSAGNVYVADAGNNTIRKVTTAGVATTLAGKPGQIEFDANGNLVPGSADGTGSAARFNGPQGVAVDSAGNVYVADTFNNTIRKVTPTGVVTTLAGLAGSYGSVDGKGSDARFGVLRCTVLDHCFNFGPVGVAVDSADNVYVADWGNGTIRKVTPAGVVTTLAGLAPQYDDSGNLVDGGAGSADGTGSAARFGVLRCTWFGLCIYTGPASVAVDSAGNVYVANSPNNTIRKGLPSVGPPVILTQPQSQTVEVTYTANFSVLVAGALPLAYQWRKDGVDLAGATNTSYTIANVRSIDAGVYSLVSTNILGAGISSNATLTTFVRPPLISVQPQSQTVATSYNVTLGVVVDGTPPLAYQWRKDGVDIVGATEPSYSIAYVQNRDAGLYRVVVTNVYGSVTSSDAELSVTIPYTFTTLAGMAGSAGSADGTGSAARFNVPWGVAMDSAGNFYVVEYGNATIRKVTPAGVVTTLAGLPGTYGSADGTGSDVRFNRPTGVAVDSVGNVYVADRDNNHTVRKVTPAGVVTTLAGLAGVHGSGDGTGSAVRFYEPAGVAVDSAGNVYVADSANSTIRKVTPAGLVTTLAGLAGSFGSLDGTGSAARFKGPQGVAVDSVGNVYVADTENHTIRKVTPTGGVMTLAGLAGSGGSADGTGSAAQFNRPFGVAVDSAGNVYVADFYNHSIRKVTPAGVVTTLAGNGFNLVGGYADGTGSAARFAGPSGVAVDSAGNVYVADAGNHLIRKGYQAPIILSSGPGFGFSAGQFNFNLRPAGLWVIVEASTDLVSWLPLWTNNFPGVLNFSDPQNGVSSHRFYRAVSPP